MAGEGQEHPETENLQRVLAAQNGGIGRPRGEHRVGVRLPGLLRCARRHEPRGIGQHEPVLRDHETRTATLALAIASSDLDVDH